MQQLILKFHWKFIIKKFNFLKKTADNAYLHVNIYCDDEINQVIRVIVVIQYKPSKTMYVYLF